MVQKKFFIPLLYFIIERIQAGYFFFNHKILYSYDHQ